MKVRDVLKAKGAQVYSIRPDQTLHDALATLVQHHVGALLVLEGGEPVGIISERDVLRECLQRADRLGAVPVREAMTRNLIVSVPDDDLGYIMGVMTQNRIRHLPVMDGPKVAGIISIGDAVKACLEESEYENRYLKEYITAR
jgi:CBS domain-containing protein